MTIAAEFHKLNPTAVVTMYVIDLTSLGGTVLRYHNDVNELGADVVWQGQTFGKLPLEASGFDVTGNGQLPRPMLKVSNVTGAVSALCFQFRDLVGASVTRKRTFLKYLDAVNFTGGVNATADPNAHFADETFAVNRKALENKEVVEFELVLPSDVEGVRIPRRQFMQNLCTWQYRSSECGYSGGAVAKADDTATADLAQDVCGKRLASCKLRFGASNPLPYGGFPAVGLIQI